MTDFKEKKRGTLIVLSGPSGAGKSTVIAQLLERCRDIYFSVSFTTRQPRSGEVDGVNYCFVTRTEFEQMIAQNEFLEYAEYVGNYYGTSMKVIEDHLKQGTDVLLEIEVQGALKVHAKCPDAVMIFVIPPSLKELETRLRTRATDGESVIVERLAQTRREYQEIPNYDYLVVNSSPEEAVCEIVSILAAESCRVKNKIHLIEGA